MEKTAKILLIQHTNTTTTGVVSPWLERSGRPYDHIRLYKGDPVPQDAHYEQIILCGGGVHVDQEDQHPWLKSEKKFLEKSIKNGSRIVGLCLGGQLCAQVLGAKVYPHPQGWEVGWHPIDLLKSPGLAGFEKDLTLPFSQYHRYIFETPKDAQVIARNDWWEAQAFQWNQQVVAFQFHPERNLISNREIALELDLPTEGRTQNQEEILKFGELYQPHSTQWFEGMLDGFFAK